MPHAAPAPQIRPAVTSTKPLTQSRRESRSGATAGRIAVNRQMKIGEVDDPVLGRRLIMRAAQPRIDMPRRLLAVTD